MFWTCYDDNVRYFEAGRHSDRGGVFILICPRTVGHTGITRPTFRHEMGLPEKPPPLSEAKVGVVQDFVAEHAKNVVLEEVLKEAINSEGCYEMPSWMTRSGKPECIYFDREDEIDNETYDVTPLAERLK